MFSHFFDLFLIIENIGIFGPKNGNFGPESDFGFLVEIFKNKK